MDEVSMDRGAEEKEEFMGEIGTVPCYSFGELYLSTTKRFLLLQPSIVLQSTTLSLLMFVKLSSIE